MVPDVEEGPSSFKVSATDAPADNSSSERPPSVDKAPERVGFAKWHNDTMLYMRGYPTPTADEMRPPTFWQQLFCEVIGTSIYCFFGLAAMASAITAGATEGTFQVVIVWAIAVSMAIIVSVSVSGAHLNPAITACFLILRPDHFPAWKAPFYIVAQVVGGMLGAGLMYGMYANAITQFEAAHGIVRGEPSSELTAAIFHGFYPSPTSLVNSELGWSANTVTAAGAFGIEAFGTGFICFIVFAVMDPRNQLRLGGAAIAYTIGFSVFLVGCACGPLENMGLNPARDLGPRLVAASIGYGEIALPGPDSGMWIYIIAPMIGGPMGAALYDWVFMRAM